MAPTKMTLRILARFGAGVAAPTGPIVVHQAPLFLGWHSLRAGSDDSPPTSSASRASQPWAGPGARFRAGLDTGQVDVVGGLSGSC